MCFPHSVAARQVAGPLIHAIYGSFVELSADSISILVHRRTRNGRFIAVRQLTKLRNGDTHHIPVLHYDQCHPIAESNLHLEIRTLSAIPLHRIVISCVWIARSATSILSPWCLLQ